MKRKSCEALRYRVKVKRKENRELDRTPSNTQHRFKEENVLTISFLTYGPQLNMESELNNTITKERKI